MYELLAQQTGFLFPDLPNNEILPSIIGFNVMSITQKLLLTLTQSTLPPQETIIFWASENELIITYTH